MAPAENNAECLLARARRAAERAHCPYSNFHVGAAVRCDDGSVIDGCNVENAICGLNICASGSPFSWRSAKENNRLNWP